jgi:DNA polymerase-4
VNKTVSKIATDESKPHGKLYVPSDRVRAFLNPLSIRKIPMVGDKTYQVLSRINIRTIQTLSEVPAELLEQLLGENGRTLWKKANGIDNTPVEPYSERKSISSELTFDHDTIDIPKLKSLLGAMVEKLAYQLRKEEWLTSTVVVKVRYANFDTETQQGTVQYTSCDHILIKRAQELFDKLYRRRMRLRLIGIKFTGLVHGVYQINMFEDTQEMVALYQAMDRMRKRFGYESIIRCSGMDIKPR